MRTWPAIDVGGLHQAPAQVAAGAGARGGTADVDGGTCLDRFQVSLTDLVVAAIDERTVDLWRVFFHTDADRDHAMRTLRGTHPHLSFAAVDVPDEDWAARSQASLRAVRVGCLIVAPPWDVPATDEGQIVIAIQPSMGFGTGHHATTRLCLAALQRVGVRGRTVIDVGTGSGVLALAAALLGGVDVIGIDDDADAIQSAQENLELNPRASVAVQAGDFRTMHLVPSDVVLANLTGSLLVSASDRLRDLTAAGGRLILSGFLAHEETGVLAAYAGWAVDERSQEEEWRCVTLRHPHQS